MNALIAGFGNSLYGDHAFGCEAARILAAQQWPAEVRVIDCGTRSMHVPFDMLEGYDLIVFIDTVWRGGEPGTLYVLEPEKFAATIPDERGMELHNVLATYADLARNLDPSKRPSIVVIGCEPASTEEGVGMSEPVKAALPGVLPLVMRVLARFGIGIGMYVSE